MHVIDQPVRGCIGDKIQDTLSITDSSKYDVFYIVSAYVKKSGVIRLAPFLKKFRDCGGRVCAVVGIDQKNTSQQGLALLLPLCDEIFVFHSESMTQTFHPKIYIFEKTDISALVFVGSNNLTAGGLYSNYEATGFFEYDLNDAHNKRDFAQWKLLFSSYSDTSSPCCKRLDADLLQSLIDEGYLSNEEVVAAAIGRSVTRTGRTPIFGNERFQPPPVVITPVSAQRTSEVSGISAVDIGFWKKLSSNDVSLTSSPGQIIIPIGFIGHFPTFPALTTTPSGASQAELYFNVIFVDKDGVRTRIDKVRAIHYIPAPSHARQNQELRFTFRSRDVLIQLKEDDILEFKKTADPDVWYIVRHIPVGSTDYGSHTGRYSSLP